MRTLLAFLVLGSSFILPSCSSMLDTDSENLQFAEDNKLNHSRDTLSSVMGIISKMQEIADRTVLLGEVRADLVTPTPRALTSIKELAAFDITDNNSYCDISNYYAVINNCNFFIENVDTTLTKLGKKIFEREYAAVKTYRAWTYLQLAKVYGSAPLMLKPALTEKEADEYMNMPHSDMQAICEYFIHDLEPLVDVKLPDYNGIPDEYFIPVRVLLGELCLWAGQYEKAATFLYQYITMKNHPVFTGVNQAAWGGVNNRDFINAWTSLAGYTNNVNYVTSDDVISYIPMERNEYYGTVSYINNVYNSIEANNYYAQAIPSEGMKMLSFIQNYCYEEVATNGKRDTIYAPHENLSDEYLYGDLRFKASYDKRYVNVDENSEYSKERYTIKKVDTDGVIIYRRQQVYLMFAEALCRAGYPESAVCVLKYGMRNKNIERGIGETERARAAAYLNFDDEIFKDENTIGVHSRGCGNAECDKYYSLPLPPAECSYEDSVAYQIPLVEDMIVNEIALEQAFEGQRFFSLMRVALRRNDPAYLAEPISRRDGEKNTALYNLLLDKKNWYLPKR